MGLKSTSDPGAGGWAAGRRIGRYKLVLALGGSFGQRFIGVIEEGPEQGRLVLLKRLPTESQSTADLDLLTRAGITAMVIRHPKIAAVLDVISEEGRLAVVSEYVEGDTLGELQRAATAIGCPLPPPVALSIVRDAVDALCGARDQWRQMVRAGAGMPTDGVHGGLGPEGITITTLGETMLSEIGVTGALARHPALIQHPAMLPYRAPEQLTGSRGLMERCDVFTLGVMAWELLATRPLFGRVRGLCAESPGDRAATIKSVLDGPIPPLDTLPGAAIPSAVSDLVRTALLRDPLRRVASLDKLAAGLAELPRSLFAPSSEVSKVVDQLLRSSLQERRDTLGHLIAVEHSAGSHPPAARRISVPPRASRELIFDEPSSRPHPPAPERSSARPADRSARRRTPPQSFASVHPPEVAPAPKQASAIRTTAIAGTPAHVAASSRAAITERAAADDAETPTVPPVVSVKEPAETSASSSSASPGNPTPVVPRMPEEAHERVTLVVDDPASAEDAPAARQPPAAARAAPARAETSGSGRRNFVWIATGVAAAAVGGFVVARSLDREAATPPPPPAQHEATAPAPLPTPASTRETPVGDASTATGVVNAEAPASTIKRAPRTTQQPRDASPAPSAEPTPTAPADEDGGSFRPRGI